jgi:hypothetical protein
MRFHYSVIAVPILVCGAATAGAVQASARPVDPDYRHRNPPVLVEQPGPRVEVPVDDATTEALQTTAGALAGAGLALSGAWLYRRRHPLAAH